MRQTDSRRALAAVTTTVALLMAVACSDGGGGAALAQKSAPESVLPSPAALASRGVRVPKQMLTITSTEEFTPGIVYGSVGTYERLSGSIQGEVDPADPANAIIQDLELAPVNAGGMVEYTAEFVMLKPKDMSKANGVLRYDAPNRGNILTMLNPVANPGDSVYLERGYVLLYSAWQGDVPKSNPNRLTVTVPVQKNPDGSSITGPYRAELITASAVPALALPGGVFNGTMIPYAPTTLDNTQPGFSLTKRANETDPRITIAPAQWKFARCDSGGSPFPGTPDPAWICLEEGFDPRYLYELVYEAQDPLVMGVGLAALRDTVSFFRSQSVDAAGTANPVAGAIAHTIGQGTSQSGNAMKTFLHLGFNQARAGGKVFDGMFAHVAARQTNINTRFAVPGGGGAIRTDHTAFGQTAPRALAPDYVDALTGRQMGVMTRCTRTGTCPKFFLGLSGTEFWQLQGSPVLTDAYGFTDLAQPDNARVYYYSSTQHGGPGGTASINYVPAQALYPRGTVVHFTDTFRALFVALEQWVTDDVAPPASRVPSIADATLVRPDEVVFPTIKGTSWPVDGVATPVPDFTYRGWHNDYSLLDFGPDYRAEDESGIASQLPPYYTGKDYAILVPQVDPSTGLSRSGIKSIEAQAPIGTSIEFNYPSDPAVVDLVSLTGAFIPFHKTEAQRMEAGDSRPSLESLYGTQANYVAAVAAAAKSLVAERFLLPADADRRVEQAAAAAILP